MIDEKYIPIKNGEKNRIIFTANNTTKLQFNL